jgi:hypothetical protein
VILLLCPLPLHAVHGLSIQGRPRDSAPDLDTLVSEKNYPELERALPMAKLTELEHAYFLGILSDRLNRPAMVKLLPG